MFPEDKEIIKLCKSKDYRTGYKLLFEKHSSWMFGICLRYCKNYEDAEDLLQECLIKIFEAIKKFKYNSDEQFQIWLRRIVVNSAINFIKEKAKINNLIATDDLTDYDEEQAFDNLIDEEVLDDTPDEKQLLQAIQELPDGYRTVFNLYVFEQKSHKEIAEILNISESTSKSQLHKARKCLQNKILNIFKTICL